MKRKEIRQAYYDFVINFKRTPNKLKEFLKFANLSKELFLVKYESLSAVEADVWKHGLKSVLQTLQDSAEFAKYSCREKGMAMLYTWFDFMDLNKKFFKKSNFFKSGSFSSCQLNSFRKVSKKFIKKVIKQGFAQSEFKDRAIPPKYITSFFWSLFMMSLKNWHGKKKNKKQREEWLDAMVEKSMVFFFDSLAPNLIDSLVDMLKHRRAKK